MSTYYFHISNLCYTCTITEHDLKLVRKSVFEIDRCLTLTYLKVERK